MYLPNWLMSIMRTISPEGLTQSVSFCVRGSFRIEELWRLVGNCVLIPDSRYITAIFVLGWLIF